MGIYIPDAFERNEIGVLICFFPAVRSIMNPEIIIDHPEGVLEKNEFTKYYDPYGQQQPENGSHSF